MIGVILGGLALGVLINYVALALLGETEPLAPCAGCGQVITRAGYPFSYRGYCFRCAGMLRMASVVVILSAVSAFWVVTLEYAEASLYFLPATACARGVVQLVLLGGLLVGVRTDLEALVIPRIVLVALALVGLGAGLWGVLPVTLEGGVAGAALGYASLWVLNQFSRWLTGREGIGEGDMELLAVLGLFCGPVGVWSIAFLSSIFGLIGGAFYLICTGKSRYTRIPFIPFMALATGFHLFYQREILSWLLG